MTAKEFLISHLEAVVSQRLYEIRESDSAKALGLSEPDQEIVHQSVIALVYYLIGATR